MIVNGVPRVGLTLAAHMLVVIQSSPHPLSAKKLAAFLGICPYERSSGTSIHRSSTSRHYGLPGLRRLLSLAALSVRIHHLCFRRYFYRKVQEGKSPKLIINNVANKLLKIMVAVLNSNTPYIPNLQSVNPAIFNVPLTKS